MQNSGRNLTRSDRCGNQVPRTLQKFCRDDNEDPAWRLNGRLINRVRKTLLLMSPG